jgi:hypothetical protein
MKEEKEGILSPAQVESLLTAHPDSVRDATRAEQRLKWKSRKAQQRFHEDAEREEQSAGYDVQPGFYSSNCLCGAEAPAKLNPAQRDVGRFCCIPCAQKLGEESCAATVARLAALDGPVDPQPPDKFWTRVTCTCGTSRLIPTHVADSYEEKQLAFRCSQCLAGRKSAREFVNSTSDTLTDGWGRPRDNS